jgi:PadR family transcriptional regulator
MAVDLKKAPVDGLKEWLYYPVACLQEDAMTDSRADVVQGTLELLVLKTLSLEPMHGWGISARLRQISGDVFDVNQGSLYPALQRMLRRRWVKATWRPSENNRRARYYELTTVGRQQLDAQLADWRHSSGAVERVLRFSLQEG